MKHVILSLVALLIVVCPALSANRNLQPRVAFTNSLDDGLGSGGGSSGATTNSLPYTVPINGTNFIIDMAALGATNTLILTNYANAGLMWTNINYATESLIMIVQQGGQGYCTLVPNGRPNYRFTQVHKSIIQSTNGNYYDMFSWVPIGTNVVLNGQNWQVIP